MIWATMTADWSSTSAPLGSTCGTAAPTATATIWRTPQNRRPRSWLLRIPWPRTLPPVQTARVIWAPWLTQAAALSASPASTTTPPSDDIADGEPGEDPAADLDPGSIYDAVSLLTEDQLERAILAIPYTDKARADVARFLLQELARRDMTRALAVSRRWKAGAP